jgi:predicted AlkP superfamily phosphohydrolase/phosphomutase
VQAPEELYREVSGHAPDLLAVFDDLNVRALSTVGCPGLYAEGDDRGADACNHDWRGILVMAGAGVTARGPLPECEIYDVGVSVLSLFGVPCPEDWLGRDRTGSP